MKLIKHIKKKIQYDKKTFFLIAIICFLLLAVLGELHAQEEKTIKVGYPKMNGLTMKDEDGNYYGYDYDYLMQIAQYSGWDYKFVEVEGDVNTQLITLLEMLKNGEIDLLGQTLYMEALTEDYDYASEPYGNAYNVLAVKNDSDIYDFDTLLQKKNLKIAILKSADKRMELLDQFTSMNGISYEKIICENDEELLNAIDSEEADAFLFVDLSVPEDYHSVVKFSPTPFYFITTKGNYDIINVLNKSLNKISQSNPTLQSSLYEQHFGGNVKDFTLTSEEQIFIKEHPTLKVLVYEGNAPIQYTEGTNVRGVGKDILDKIAKKTDVEFAYYIASSYEEYKTIIQEEKIDILLGIPYEMKIANDFGVNLTNPYLKSNQILITNKDLTPDNLNGYIQAAMESNKSIFEQDDQVKYFDTAEKVIKAVNNGTADYAYLNNYVVTYYDNKYDMKNISTLTLPEYLQSHYAFGVVKSENLSLVSIMNKAILALDNELNSFIYTNAYANKEFQIFAFLQEHFLWVLLFILIVASVVLQLIRRYYRQQLKMKRQVELEYKRFQMLSEITGEITFSYDYVFDEMKISNSGIGKLSKEGVISTFSKNYQVNDVFHTIHGYLEKRKDVNENVQLTLLDGNENWYQITLKIIYDNPSLQTKAVYAIGKVKNIQQEILDKEVLLKNSLTDPLTSILNRGGAQEYIEKAILNTNQQGALLMIDLDHFKTVNDRYGHARGDDVLKESVQLFKKVFHDGILARIGGDEFIIYIKDISENEIIKNCKIILRDIQKIPCMKDEEIILTVSIGVAISMYKQSLEQYMKQADEALYKVKRKQRNDFCIYKKIQ